ncbi:helix-turn-helix domain-containing protein [Amycolatopsis jejuensis]|uniref:helix-turn-helix domain-containing protein n=1 Tax=Amycolatopsis jejuensis TaxID=330084 RepID=UPI0012E08041
MHHHHVLLLRCFLATYEYGSFTAAAERLGFTQPTLPEQVRQLERTLHTTLFLRPPRKPNERSGRKPPSKRARSGSGSSAPRRCSSRPTSSRTSSDTIRACASSSSGAAREKRWTRPGASTSSSV